MKISSNMVGWFEIPVHDMNRAITFYETIFDVKLERTLLGDLEMAMFPYDQALPGVAGALARHPEYYKPSPDGVTVYFSSQAGDLNVELGRIEGVGGKVLMPKLLIKEDVGYMALFVDTEGNRIALHSMK